MIRPGSPAWQLQTHAYTVRKLLIMLTVCVGAWGTFQPCPYNLVLGLLCALPLLALALAYLSDGGYRLDSRSGQQEPDLSHMLLIPGFILALRAICDDKLLEWSDGLLLAIAGGLVMTVLIAIADRTMRSAKFLLLCALLMASYGYGAGAFCNQLFDTQPSTSFRATVLGMHITSGKYRTPYLHLSAWGTQAESNDVLVTPALYAKLATNTTVCITLHPGAFKMPWYVVDICPGMQS